MITAAEYEEMAVLKKQLDAARSVLDGIEHRALELIHIKLGPRAALDNQSKMRDAEVALADISMDLS